MIIFSLKKGLSKEFKVTDLFNCFDYNSCNAEELQLIYSSMILEVFKEGIDLNIDNLVYKNELISQTQSEYFGLIKTKDINKSYHINLITDLCYFNKDTIVNLKDIESRFINLTSQQTIFDEYFQNSIYSADDKDGYLTLQFHLTRAFLKIRDNYFELKNTNIEKKYFLNDFLMSIFKTNKRLGYYLNIEDYKDSEDFYRGIKKKYQSFKNPTEHSRKKFNFKTSQRNNLIAEAMQDALSAGNLKDPL